MVKSDKAVENEGFTSCRDSIRGDILLSPKTQNIMDTQKVV